MAKRQCSTYSRVKSAVYGAVLVIGLCVIAAPVAFDAYSSWRAQQVITTLESTLDESEDPARIEQLVQARAYNDRMVSLPYDEPEDGIWPYDDQLSWKGKPYMAYLQVPKAHIKTPIYHGTADEELAAGVGHLEGRSLPVGGQTSLCVLEGHSGMLTSRMFDDIRMLDEGDMLCIWSLEDPYAYKVDRWEIVKPDEVIGRLEFTEGVDKVVLITCTTEPDALNEKGRVGVNDRRLMVHATRCEYDPDYFAEKPLIADIIESPRSWPFIVCIAVLLTAAIAAAVLRRCSRKKTNHKSSS